VPTLLPQTEGEFVSRRPCPARRPRRPTGLAPTDDTEQALRETIGIAWPEDAQDTRAATLLDIAELVLRLGPGEALQDMLLEHLRILEEEGDRFAPSAIRYLTLRWKRKGMAA
jgi:hypothetical protein